LHLLISVAGVSLFLWRQRTQLCMAGWVVSLLLLCVHMCITGAFFVPKRRDSCIICMHSIHQQLKVFYSDAAAAFSSLNAFFNPFRPLCGMNMRVVLLRALCTLTPWMLARSPRICRKSAYYVLQPAACSLAFSTLAAEIHHGRSFYFSE
jgi:hypothetical protein